MINRKILRSVRFVSRFQLLNYEKKMKKKTNQKNPRYYTTPACTCKRIDEFPSILLLAM